MHVDFNTWAVEAGQQVAVGGRSLVGQGGERRCRRGELGQLGGKVTRKTEKEKKHTYIKLRKITQIPCEA